MPDFNNFTQVQDYLLQVIADCMNEVGAKVEDLMKQHVESDVYDVGDSLGRNTYERTGELCDSITYTEPTINRNEIVTEVGNDTSRIHSEPENFIHGSKYWTQNDVSDILPYLINEGKTGDLFGAVWESLKRPYIENTRRDIISQDLVGNWFQQALKKRGLEILYNSVSTQIH